MKVVINFSNRKDGNCYQISGLILGHFKGTKVKIYNFCDYMITTCGKCEYDCFQKKCSVNDGINEIYNSILQSEETYFVMPNYCDYPCSNYFIFNERGTGYFRKNKDLLKRYLDVPKRFIVITQTNVCNFKNAFIYQVRSDVTPDVLFLNAKKFHQTSISGNIMEGKEAKQIIHAYLDNHYQIEKSAMAIVVCDNNILTTVEEVYDRPTLSLPKGHIEEGETSLDAAIRECFEETNEVITKDEFVKELDPFDIVFVNHKNKLIKKYIYPLIFKLEKTGTLLAKEERIKKVKYLPINDFLVRCSYDNVRAMIKDAITKK